MPSKISHARVGLVLAAAMLAMIVAPTAMAAKLVKRNLIQLVADSETIVAGTVTKVSDGFSQEGVPYTQVTIAVSSAAKGNVAKAARSAGEAGTDYTFRQFGLLKPRVMDDGRTFLGVTPDGFARWHEGETVIAFLHKPASITGLQTTAGLTQGKLVLRNGRYANEFNNRGLFDDMQIDTDQLTPAQQNMLMNPGPADAAALMDLIRRAVDENWSDSVEVGK